MGLAVAEDRAANMEALEREAVQLAAKLDSAKSELKDSQNRVQTLNEVRVFSVFTLSAVLLMLHQCRHCKKR